MGGVAEEHPEGLFEAMVEGFAGGFGRGGEVGQGDYGGEKESGCVEGCWSGMGVG